MIEIKKFINNYEVLDNGILFAKLDEIITFKVADLVLSLILRDDDGNKNTRIESSNDDKKKKLHLELINFKSTFGNGLKEYTEIGVINNKKLKINFSAYKKSNITELHYCLILESDV